MYGGTSTITANASVSLFTGSTGGYNIGASTAPFTHTSAAPVAVAGTYAMIAGGAFVTINTGDIVTWTVTVSVYAGSITTFRGYSYATFTRIG